MVDFLPHPRRIPYRIASFSASFVTWTVYPIFCRGISQTFPGAALNTNPKKSMLFPATWIHWPGCSPFGVNEMCKQTMMHDYANIQYCCANSTLMKLVDIIFPQKVSSPAGGEQFYFKWEAAMGD